MQVSDQELRQLVRDAIARQTAPPEPAVVSQTLSFGKFLTLAPTPDGQCIIEPAVRCSHCGFCESYGH